MHDFSMSPFELDHFLMKNLVCSKCGPETFVCRDLEERPTFQNQSKATILNLTFSLLPCFKCVPETLLWGRLSAVGIVYQT